MDQVSVAVALEGLEDDAKLYGISGADISDLVAAVTDDVIGQGVLLFFFVFFIFLR